jgi:hypothetical protein
MSRKDQVILAFGAILVSEMMVFLSVSNKFSSIEKNTQTSFNFCEDELNVIDPDFRSMTFLWQIIITVYFIFTTEFTEKKRPQITQMIADCFYNTKNYQRNLWTCFHLSAKICRLFSK